MHDFYEFFAGGGMARAGLGDNWNCLFANDFSPMKVAAYTANWGGGHIHLGDVGKLATTDLPGNPAMAWASFPCQDLSLAGAYRGLGAQAATTHTRSGSFWSFWGLMEGIIAEGRGPKLIVLENVYGALTSNAGRDFAAIGETLTQGGYRFGAMVVDARLFVPQSRPRVFFVAVDASVAARPSLLGAGPNPLWHPEAMVAAHAKMSDAARANWLWWSPAAPPPRRHDLADLIEQNPPDVKWHTAAQTQAVLDMMAPANLDKVQAAMRSGALTVGGVYRRTRTENDVKVQRTEVRFDGLAGCLRTPSGGSSRQTIMVVQGNSVRTRLLSSREAARLMGLDDAYVLPARYNDAYHVCGDGVAAPCVRFLAQQILEPLLAG